MKTIILFLSIISTVVMTPKNDVIINNNVKTVTAVFDAYEGDLYFFTNTSNDEALTLIVRDESIVKDFKLKEGENIGETFQITLQRDSENAVIISLSRVEPTN